MRPSGIGGTGSAKSPLPPLPLPPSFPRPMIQDKFSQAVDEIVKRDPRFERDAYFFVRDALEYTVKRAKRTAPKPRPGGAAAPAEEGGSESPRHVSGQELLEGARQYALEQYGPMVPTVFEHWHLSRC